MDSDKLRKEIEDLVTETRLGLTKCNSFKYYVDVLKLQELQEINDRLQRISETKSNDEKLYCFSLYFKSLKEALEYIDTYKNDLPTNKFIFDISSDKITLKFQV